MHPKLGRNPPDRTPRAVAGSRHASGVAGIDRRIPAVGVLSTSTVSWIGAWITAPKGKLNPGYAADGRKPVDGPGRVGADQHLRGIRFVRAGMYCAGSDANA